MTYLTSLTSSCCGKLTTMLWIENGKQVRLEFFIITSFCKEKFQTVLLSKVFSDKSCCMLLKLLPTFLKNLWKILPNCMTDLLKLCKFKIFTIVCLGNKLSQVVLIGILETLDEKKIIENISGVIGLQFLYLLYKHS